MVDWLREPHNRGLVVLALIIVIIPVAFPSSFYFRIGALIFISALAVTGLNILMGLAGQVSLGHAGFFGIGAYTVAIGPAHLGLAPWVSLLLAAVLAGLLAWLVGRPILRLKGHYLAIATLGFGILVHMVLTNEAGWTGGPDGMPVARLVLFDWSVKGSETWYWVSGFVLMVGVWGALNILGSPTGRAFRALHDSEVAASMTGIDVARYKLLAFTLSAVYASVAGSMIAFFNGFLTPDAAGFLHSIALVTMVVLGGMGSVFGGIVGAALLVTLPQLLAGFHDYEHLVLGLIMMGIMIFMRQGLLPGLVELFRGKRK
jgi:branched-chain amino acid transport system permease protein